MYVCVLGLSGGMGLESGVGGGGGGASDGRSEGSAKVT